MKKRREEWGIEAGFEYLKLKLYIEPLEFILLIHNGLILPPKTIHLK